MHDILGIIITRPKAKVEVGVISVGVDLRKVTFNDPEEV